MSERDDKQPPLMDRKTKIGLWVLTFVAATVCFRDYWTGEISGRNKRDNDTKETTPDTVNHYRLLSQHDREVIDWSIQEARKNDVKNRFTHLSDEEMRQRLSDSSDKLVVARELYDLAQEAKAEKLSGRDVTDPESPKVPLKWEALSKFQQQAVDFAVDAKHMKNGKSWSVSRERRDEFRQELLQDVANLQPAIDAYRQHLDMKRGTGRGG